MNASDDVYIKPNLEQRWQRLAEKCSPYPAGKDIEEVYWRTLVGNKRRTVDGNARRLARRLQHMAGTVTREGRHAASPFAG